MSNIHLKSLSLDVSSTPGFSPVMNHTKRRRTVLTVCSSAVDSGAVELLASYSTCRNGETVETVFLPYINAPFTSLTVMTQSKRLGTITQTKIWKDSHLSRSGDV
jgi:hypothetical protein